MVITVAPRVVAAPWEATRERDGRATFVGREAEVAPDPGPLADYRSVWPERYVVWHVPRQLFEIRQVNPDTGADERIELVCTLDAPPHDETGLPRSDEEVAALTAARSPLLVRRFRAFDYDFVRQRLREWQTFRALGAARYSEERRQQRLTHERSVRRDVVREMAAGLHEMRRWAPVLAEYQRTGNAGDALVHKPVLVPGASLR